MEERAVLAAAHQDLVVVGDYLVGGILRSMAQILLILESLPLSKPTLLPSTDELLPILPVPPLSNPTLHIALKPSKNLFHRVCQ